MSASVSVAIVSHDAGGAELLASYVAQNNIDCKFVLEGPAAKIFRRRLGAVDVCSLEEAIADCDWCLCGTGWQSNLEWRAIGYAREEKKHTVAFLDHWINYKERFIRNEIQHMPDEIWVGDQDAKALASFNFPDIPIRHVPNPYFIDLMKQIEEIKITNKSKNRIGERILFVCENISEHSRLKYGDENYWGYTEFDAIGFFFKNIHRLGKQIAQVIIRPHPSDSFGKYDWVIDAYPGIARLSDGSPLIQEIVESDMVAGCESMAMVVGLLAQKAVTCCIPSAGHPSRLPQRGITHLRELIK